MSKGSWIVSAIAAMFLFLGAGCYHVRVATVTMPPAEFHRVWMHGFLYGLVGSEVSSESVCGNRPVAAVDSFMSVPNMLVSALTLGIYTPMTVRITCAATTVQ